MYTIGTLAKAAGVGVETIRFYQRQGLLEVPESSGKVRRYQDEHLQSMRFIKGAQAAGFSLKEIKQLLAMDPNRDHEKAQQLASQRLSAIDQQIIELKSARKVLQKLASACEHSRHQPCPIIEAFIEGDY